MPRAKHKLRTFRVGLVGYKRTPATLAEVKVKAADAETAEWLAALLARKQAPGFTWEATAL